ncbi:hypothetical protein JOB18_004281 [Solea senegalensis]|uniref:Uncharacterized protein n=1 Tax=Solea senegalensis TaxID=28829 RepID=A0AAV6Q3M7_SOLSE|nr:hypothetical protein JOB18_004281 [Solea senegalensis]
MENSRCYLESQTDTCRSGSRTAGGGRTYGLRRISLIWASCQRRVQKDHMSASGAKLFDTA